MNKSILEGSTQGKKMNFHLNSEERPAAAVSSV